METESTFNDEAVSYPRQEASYKACYERFVINTKNYIQQYNQIYIQRFLQMKDHLRRRASLKWSNAPLLDRIIDIDVYKENAEECILVGILVKDLTLRKSVIDDYREGSGSSLRIDPLAPLASDHDRLILEDQTGRVLLTGSVSQQVGQLVTGIIVAVRGRINEQGEFHTTDSLFCYDVSHKLPAPQPPKSIADLLKRPPSVKLSTKRFVMFLSGLNFSSEQTSGDLPVQLLMDFLNGRLDEASAELAASIVRVVIAGDSLSPSTPSNTNHIGHTSSSLNKGNKIGAMSNLVMASRTLDLFLAQALATVPVDIMPGPKDPANLSIPQQPLHSCLLPQAARFTTLQRVSNPYAALIDGVAITGDSGQPVRDVARQTFELGNVRAISKEEEGEQEIRITSTEEDEGETAAEDEGVEQSNAGPVKLASDVTDPTRRLVLMEHLLSWGHLAPSFPDTAPCYPFSGEDPFVLLPATRVPRLYFAGNQPAFATSLVEIKDQSASPEWGHSVRLVCLPSFRDTATVVLCDISDPDLPCYPVRFA
eukprot:gene7283-8060_t